MRTPRHDRPVTPPSRSRDGTAGVRIIRPWLVLCSCIAWVWASSLLPPGAPELDLRRGRPAQEPVAVLHMPLLTHGWLIIELPLAATARARAATQTALARPSATPSPTASPRVSPSATATVLPTPTFRPSDTPSPSATDRFTATASPSPTGPTPTASNSPTASDTPTVTPTPTITPTPSPRKPEEERLRPLAAWREGENRVRFDRVAGIYRLTHAGSITQTWELDLGHPDNQRGRLALRQVESGRYPIAGAGLAYRDGEGRLYEPRLLGSIGAVVEITHSLLAETEGPGLEIEVTEQLDGSLHRKRYRLRMQGRAIELRARSLDGIREPDQGSYAGFSAGDIEGSQDALSLRLPYMDAVPVTMLDHRWFVSSLLDYPRSAANQLLPRGPEILPGAVINEVATRYLPDAAGRTAPVDETLWLVLSPQVEDVFALPDGAPARHRSALSSRLHVRLEGRADRPAEARAETDWLERLRGWGVEDWMVHRSDWRDPEQLLPGHRPAPPAADFERLSTAARGRLVASLALTTTVSPCPGLANPYYDPADRVIAADGLPKPAGSRACPGGGATEAWLLAPNASLPRAQQLVAGPLSGLGLGGIELGEIAAYQPGYAWPGAFDNALDRSPRPNHPATIGQAIAAYKELFQSLSARLGPVFGPGTTGVWEPAYESFYAGYLDGSPRSLSTGSIDAPAGDPYLVLPDYELRVVRPRMIGYGMGDFARFFGAPVDRPLGDAAIDSWRATSLAYGHAGAWSLAGTALAAGEEDYLTLAEQVETYYLMGALQRRYLDAELLSVGYRDATGELDLSAALRADLDLARPRLHLAYRQAGQRLDLWINHAAELWTIEAGGQAHLLPTHGWLALGEDGLLAYSALVEGHRVDYLRAPEIRVMDGRGRATDFEGRAATDLRVELPDGRAIVEEAGGVLVWRGP